MIDKSRRSPGLIYGWLSRFAYMLEAVGTTTYAYTTGGQLWTQDGPFASSTVTNTYQNRRRISLKLQQPAEAWTNGFGYDVVGRLTNATSQAGTFGYTIGGASSASPQPKKIRLPNTSYITNTWDSVARLTGTFLRLAHADDLDQVQTEAGRFVILSHQLQHQVVLPFRQRQFPQRQATAAR
jgi:hypothetical protein